MKVTLKIFRKKRKKESRFEGSRQKPTNDKNDMAANTDRIFMAEQIKVRQGMPDW